MAFILVGLIAFFAGYTVCFNWMKKDIEVGKPISFKSGIYTASKRSLRD